MRSLASMVSMVICPACAPHCLLVELNSRRNCSASVWYVQEKNVRSDGRYSKGKLTSTSLLLQQDTVLSFFPLSSVPYYGIIRGGGGLVAKGREFRSCEASVAKDLVLGSPLTSFWSAAPKVQSRSLISGAGDQDSNIQNNSHVRGGEEVAAAVQVVGVGSKVPAIFNFCHGSALLPGAGFWVIPQDSQQFDQLLLHQGCAITIDVEFDIGNQVHQTRRVALSSADKDVFLKGLPRATAASFLYKVAAGSMVNLETATSLFQESQKKNQLAVSIMVLPFKFEGQKCRREAEATMSVLRRLSDILLVVEQDALLQQEMVTVSEAGTLACTAVLQGIRAISDLLLVPDKAKLDGKAKGRLNMKNSQVYQMLLQGGQSYVGFGRGESVKIAVEAASLKSPFIRGWLAEEHGPVLCTLASVVQITPLEFEESLSLLRSLVGPKVEVVCMPIKEPTLDPGVISATIIITGINTSPQALPSQPNDLVQGSSALKKHGTPENLWTLNTFQLSRSLGMFDKRHIEISSDDVGMSTHSPLLPVEEETEVLISIVSKGHQGLSILSSLSEGTMESNKVLPPETKGWSLASKAIELTTNGLALQGTMGNVRESLQDPTVKENKHISHKSKTHERLSTKALRELGSGSRMPVSTNSLRTASVEKGHHSDVTGKKLNSFSDDTTVKPNAKLNTKHAKPSSIILKMNYTRSEDIPWRSGPSSAVAEAWAKSREEVRNKLVLENSAGTTEPLNGEGALGIHMGIWPQSEKQRVVIPQQHTSMEVLPVDPAAVPRSGIGFLLDVYRSMLQGDNKRKAGGVEETLVQEISLSQRAASMLESERSRKKLTPVMELKLEQGVYKGRCLAGLPDGKGRLTYKDGSFYEGQWKQGKREGNGTLYYTNGDVFQGFWKDDLKHGKGWLYFHNGDRLYADYLNGRANGEGRLYFTEGDVFFGHFIDNWRHGDCLYIEASGLRWREMWDYGKLLSKTLSGRDSSQRAGS